MTSSLRRRRKLFANHRPSTLLTACIYLVAATLTTAETSGNATANEEFYRCIPGMESSGVSLPRGDIVKKVGSESLPIYCHLNPNHKFYKTNGLRANSLGFYAQNTLHGSNHQVRQLESRVLNETTIVADYNPDRMTKDSVECKVKVADGSLRGICTQYIYVGYEPLLPENFECISHNWQDLNCTWSEPFNPAKTKYELSFVEQGRYGSQRFCPSVNNSTRSPASYCYMNLRTEPHFRQAMRTYRFLMNMTNGLKPEGSIVKLPVDVHAVVKPNPANVTLKPVDPHTIEVHFMIHHNVAYFKPGFSQLIRFKSELDPDWISMNETDLNSEATDHLVKLEDLIPFAEYTVEFKYISRVANRSDTRLWSDPTVVKARTLSKVPDLCPDTNLGSFEVVANGLQERTVYVYWKQIPRTSQNGPDFRYRITEVFEDGVPRPLVQSKYTPGYAMFSNLGLNNYTFYVTSENQVGTAYNASKVFVPRQHDIRGLQPRSFTKIAFSERFFEVSWLPPQRLVDVISYTVYWCKSEDNRDRPYQCEGQLDWKEVGNETRSVNITLPTENIYQFAVAANTIQYSSGMVWATCTILHNKVVGKLKTVSVDVVEMRSMRVSWRLDCSDRVGIVTGYKISYCPVKSRDQPEACLDRQILTHEAPADAEHAWINDLDPWTVYKVGVAVVTRAGESELSDYLVNRTKPDRPGSRPRDLTAYSTNNSRSVRLDWETPSKPNGPIRFYQIQYSYTNFKGELVENGATSDDLTTTIRNLEVNTEYTFKVRACSEIPITQDVACSQDWGATCFKTGVGESGMMAAPLVTFTNSTEVRIAWDPINFHRGGPIVRFDIRISYQRTGNVHIVRIPADRASLVSVALDKISAEQDWTPDCLNTSTLLTNMYNFSIRAISADKSKHEFDSPWSKNVVLPGYCPAEIPLVLILCLTTIIPVCMVIATVYFCRCFNWSNRTSDLFKDVTKEMAHHAAAKTNTTTSSVDDNNTSNGEQDEKIGLEMQERPSSQNAKRPNYVRAGSKDSMETLLTANPKRNISGNSDTTSGCESGGPSCEDSDADEAAERPINKKAGNNVGNNHSGTNLSNIFDQQCDDDDEEDGDEAETPKAVDQINFVRLPPPSPPPLKQHSYVMGFPVHTLAVKIPAPVNAFEDYTSGSVTSSVPTTYSYCPSVIMGSSEQQQPPPRIHNPSNGYVSFASVRDMSRHMPPPAADGCSDPSTPTSLTGSYDDGSSSPPITPTPFQTSFMSASAATHNNANYSPLSFDFNSQIHFDPDNIRMGSPDNIRMGSSHKQNNLANPLQRSKVSPMPLNLTSTQQQQQHDDNARTSANNTTTPPTTLASLNSTPTSEFVIFPRELHVESRAPHNRIVSTVDSSYADRRYTMV